MSKTVLIFKHEFLHMVKSKGFIIMTLLFPLIGIGAIGIYQLTQIDGKAPDSIDIPRIGYVDESGGFDYYANDFGRITLVPYSTQDEATDALLVEDIDEYFVILADYLQRGQVTRYHTEKELEMSGETY